MAKLNKYVRIRAQPDELLTHLAWLEALPDAEVSVNQQPEDPEVSVIHVQVPFGEPDDDAEAIFRHWERENPGTILREWLDESEDELAGDGPSA